MSHIDEASHGRITKSVASLGSLALRQQLTHPIEARSAQSKTDGQSGQTDDADENHIEIVSGEVETSATVVLRSKQSNQDQSEAPVPANTVAALGSLAKKVKCRTAAATGEQNRDKSGRVLLIKAKMGIALQ